MKKQLGYGDVLLWAGLMAALQVINYNVVYEAVQKDVFAVGETIVVVILSLTGVMFALRTQVTKWVSYPWAATQIVNLSLVWQGLIKLSVKYQWEITPVLLVGTPLLVMLYFIITRNLATAIKKGNVL